jgi:hypothetical protein
MPKTAENAPKNRGSGCQKQQGEDKSEERRPTAAERAENRAEKQAILVCWSEEEKKRET